MCWSILQKFGVWIKGKKIENWEFILLSSVVCGHKCGSWVKQVLIILRKMLVISGTHYFWWWKMKPFNYYIPLYFPFFFHIGAISLRNKICICFNLRIWIWFHNLSIAKQLLAFVSKYHTPVATCGTICSNLIIDLVSFGIGKMCQITVRWQIRHSRHHEKQSHCTKL